MGSFKLGGMTLKSLFSKPETIMYPVQERYRPEGLKGHIVLDTSSCILCGVCQRACPSHAITVDKENNSWSINRFSCIQCRACIAPCAKNSLSMADTYTAPAAQMSVDTYEVHPPERPARKAKAEGEEKAAPVAKGEKAAAAGEAKAEAKAATEPTSEA